MMKAISSIVMALACFALWSCGAATTDVPVYVPPAQPPRLPLAWTHTDQTTTGGPVYVPTAQTTTGGPVYVHGYTRANGTYVAPYTRRR